MTASSFTILGSAQVLTAGDWCVLPHYSKMEIFQVFGIGILIGAYIVAFWYREKP